MADVTVGNKNFRLPDKVGATIISLVLLALAAGTLIKYEELLIQLAQDTTWLAIEGVVAFLVVTTIWSSREAIWYAQQNFIRKIRRAIIAEDPVGILDSVINRMNAKQEELTGNIEKARASLARLKKQRDDFAAKEQNEESLAKVAQSKGLDEEDIQQHVIAAGRWQKAADTTKPMIDTLTEMAAKFQDALVICRRSIADATNQKDVLAAQLAAMKDGQAAVKGFRAFMGRNPELLMQKEAVDEIERQASEAEASIDQFMRDVTPVLDADNLQRQADAKTAMAKFGGFLKQSPALPGVVDGHVVSSGEKELVRK